MMQTSEHLPSLSRALDLEDQRPTRDAFLKHFSAQLRAHGFPSEIATARRSAVSWFLADTNCAPHEVTRACLDRFIERLVKNGASAHRVANIRQAVTSAFDEMCGRPVAAQAKETGPQKAPATTEKTEPENNATAIREELMVVLARDVGLRANEIAPLRWSDVKLERGLIVLEQARGCRRLALTERASTLLNGAKKLVAESSVHVFPSPRTSTHVSIRSVQHVLRAARETTVGSSTAHGSSGLSAR